jgi:hypothetical protein
MRGWAMAAAVVGGATGARWWAGNCSGVRGWWQVGDGECSGGERWQALCACMCGYVRACVFGPGARALLFDRVSYL